MLFGDIGSWDHAVPYDDAYLDHMNARSICRLSSMKPIIYYH